MSSTNVYIQLSYDDYKHVEDQLEEFKKIETTHRTVEGAYHKAFRLQVGTITFEFQGPLVKAPLES